MKKKISPSQAQKYFNQAIGLPIWEIAYVADSIFFFKIGKKIKTTILSEDMKSKEPYKDGEYVLYLDGDWQFFEKNKNIVSSNQLKIETNKKYYDKMYALENLLKKNVLKIVSIKISQLKAKVEFNNELHFLFQTNEFGMLSITSFNDTLIYYDDTSQSFIKEKCRG